MLSIRSCDSVFITGSAVSCFWRNVSLRHLQSPANNGAEQLNLPGPPRGGRRISHTVKTARHGCGSRGHSQPPLRK